MLLRAKYLFILLLLLCSVNHTQTIKSIEINGDREFSRSDILSWGKISQGDKIYPGILDSIKSRLAENFSDRGFFHSTFDNAEIIQLPDTGSVLLKIDIEENDPTFLNKIEYFNLSSFDSAVVIPDFDFLKGNVFNKYDIEESINSTLKYYSDNGNPFVKIVIKNINLYSDTVDQKYYADLDLLLEKGEKSTIDEIVIRGNTKTKESVILRELRLQNGEKFSQQTLDDIPYRLNRLGFFDPVSAPEYYFNSEGKGVLAITVKEKQTNIFDGIIGYIPGATPDESGYFTGLVNISLRNLFGTGRAAAIRWQKLNRSSQELELKYMEPWVLGFPVNINLGLFQRKQDTTYVQRNLNFALEYLATETISASFTFATESVIPSDTDTLSLTVYSSNSISTGLNFKIDTRDDPYSPTQGLLFINSYTFSRKTIDGPKNFIAPGMVTDINLQKFSLELKLFYEPFTRQVIALGLNGRELQGTFFEQSDLFRLGGTNSLRGYREDQFLGSRVLWSNLEYRFLLTKRSFAFLFLDTGYYLRKVDQSRNIPKSEGYKIGYGLGINLETGIGVIGVSFGLAKGDSFTDGKIHFGIVNQF